MHIITWISNVGKLRATEQRRSFVVFPCSHVVGVNYVLPRFGVENERLVKQAKKTD